jgi:hypothetical protein
MWKPLPRPMSILSISAFLLKPPLSYEFEICACSLTRKAGGEQERGKGKGERGKGKGPLKQRVVGTVVDQLFWIIIAYSKVSWFAMFIPTHPRETIGKKNNNKRHMSPKESCMYGQRKRKIV